MNCSRCGAANPEGMQHCQWCGTAMAGAPAAPGTAGVGNAASAHGGSTGMAAGWPQAAVFPYGGFWIRFVAYLIDGVILSVVYGVFMVAGGLSAGTEAMMIVGILTTLIGLAYYIALPPNLGATPGKAILGYHIVDGNGQRISYVRSFIRYIAMIVSSMALLLGFIWIGIDARKQGWHDKIAGTFVVRKEFASE